MDGTGRLVGVIEVVRSDQDRPFARDEDLLLRFLALQAAISLRSGEVIDSVGAMQSKMQDYEKRVRLMIHSHRISSQSSVVFMFVGNLSFVDSG